MSQKQLLPNNSVLQLSISEYERLCVEYEFVQNLSNSSYLHFLAQHQYFEDSRFMNFLRYLRYWKQPEYLQYLAYPQCLTFLDQLIDNSDFRRLLLSAHHRDAMHQQQGLLWQYGANGGGSGSGETPLPMAGAVGAADNRTGSLAVPTAAAAAPRPSPGVPVGPAGR